MIPDVIKAMDIELEKFKIKSRMRYDCKDLDDTLVLRVNCQDCLDRTNVAQLFFTKIFLEQSSVESEGFEDREIETFRSQIDEIWDLNGNALSLQNTGTESTTRGVVKKEKLDFSDKLMKMTTGAY